VKFENWLFSDFLRNHQYYCKKSRFLNQEVDIKFISGLVNKKPRIGAVNRLNKLKIAKPTFILNIENKETPYVVALR
jgi:hypothetical protein